MKAVTIIDNINGEARRKHMSQDVLCKGIGVDRRRYTAWQQKGDMPMSYFLKCAVFLGCSLDYLARDVEPSTDSFTEDD